MMMVAVAVALSCRAASTGPYSLIQHATDKPSKDWNKDNEDEGRERVLEVGSIVSM